MLVNQIIPGFFGGVSQQDHTLRHKTQVTEMVNCFPTIVGGTVKRPPTSLVENDPTFPSNSYIYSYSVPSTNEQYIVTIKQYEETDTNILGAFRIYDVIKKVWVNPWTQHSYLTMPLGSLPRDCFSLTTVGDSTFIVNKTVITQMYTEQNLPYTISEYHILENYYVNPKVTSDSGMYDTGQAYSYTSYDINGTVSVTISMDIDGVPTSHSTTSPTISYSSSSYTQTAYDVSKLIWDTLSKFTYIDDSDKSQNIVPYTNKIQTAREITNLNMSISFSGTAGSLAGSHSFKTTGLNSGWDDTFFYWVKRTAGDATDNASLRYTYYIYETDKTTGAKTTHSVVGHDSNTIATQLALAIGGEAVGSVVRKIPSTSTYIGSDSWGDQASVSFTGRVKKLGDLPVQLGFPGTVLEIVGDDNNSFDSYYVLFDGNSYIETVKPFLINDINYSTMPHRLGVKRISDGVYRGYNDYTVGEDPKFINELEWAPRKVGDDVSASVPSFIGYSLSDVFFFRNRLGFISVENVVLSEVGNYYNFFPTTVTSIIDSDVIDVAVDSNRAVKLKYAMPYNRDLLLFGDSAQFIMSSSESLTPKTATVSQTTLYRISDVKPTTAGTSVYFCVDKDESSSIMEYYVQPDTVTNTAIDITAHCFNYIPNNVYKIVSSIKHDMLFVVSDTTPDTVYCYNYYYNGEEKVQSAWHKWTFKGTVFNIEVIDDSLFVMIERSPSDLNLEVINLEATAQFNNDVLYLDNGVDLYESKIILTRPGFATGNDKINDIRGLYQLKNIKVNADYGSYYYIEARKQRDPVNIYYSRRTGLYPSKQVPFVSRFSYFVSDSLAPSDDLYPSEDIYPDVVTYRTTTDGKYTIMGNVANMELEIGNYISRGFKINTLDLFGTYVTKSKTI